jgi:hypothetical protein
VAGFSLEAAGEDDRGVGTDNCIFGEDTPEILTCIARHTYIQHRHIHTCVYKQISIACS